MIARTLTLVMFAATLGLAPPKQPTDVRTLVEQALDETSRAITLDNVPLEDAFRQIAEQTGVELVMSAEAMALLPHGPQTRVTARIANIPLRQGLRELFAPLGMDLFVTEGVVQVEPKLVLLRLGRPVSWTELDTLATLTALQPGLKEQDRESLRGLVQFRVDVNDPWQQFAQAVRDVGAGPADEVISSACDRFGWTWVLSDERVIILPIEQLIVQQLQQPLSIRLSSRPLMDVLREVGRRLNVRVRTEPGAVASLPAQIQQSFSLYATQNTGEEVLDAIAAATGLGYLTDPDGVLFYRPATGAAGNSTDAQGGAAATDANRTDPYVAQVVRKLPDGTEWRWLIRKSELPEDLLRMRDQDRDQAINTLRIDATAAPAGKP
ncbi:MAG TPA: hypothetical protein PKK06_13620 [Phycisphaerae bacterium]|nr:hypothetical protein [Phycisphaerae bacterium]HNU46124.1 hypothetical protein [Phycisphaerae bacterium]